MPYPNEHAARINDPSKYEKFARKNNYLGQGIDVIFGIKSDGKSEIQAIRFDSKKFTKEEAKKWLKDHDEKYIDFEEAEKQMEGQKSLKLKAQSRSLEIKPEDINQDERMVTMTFSSEYPVLRSWGWEILDHGRSSVKLDRLNKSAPLILYHDKTQQVGVVDKATLKSDKRGYAAVRFSRSQKGQEIFQDVIDGIRSNVSVDYLIHKMTEEGEKDGMPVYRAISWEPIAISLEPIPADPSIGVGREMEEENEVLILNSARSLNMGNTEEQKTTEVQKPVEHTVKIEVAQPEQRTMPQASVSATVDIKVVENQTREQELSRIRELEVMGEKFNMKDFARELIGKGTPIAECRQAFIEKIGKVEPHKTDPNLGMNEAEIRGFSMVRAISAIADGSWGRGGAGFEKEASDAWAKKIGRQSRGFFVPGDVLKRDLGTTTTSVGGALVATDLLTASFIDMLRNKMVVKQLGATILDGLQGNIAIPRQTQGATAYWVGEGSAPSESNQAFDQVTMSPKSVAAYTDITRKLILQASLDIENLVRNDIATTLAMEIDRAAIDGSGSGNQPTGILKTSGIGSVAASAHVLTQANIIELETDIAVENADFGKLAYLTNAHVRGLLKGTFTNSTYGEIPLWMNRPGTPGEGELNGYRAMVSNQVPSTITSDNLSAILFGNWGDLLMGFWSGLDILVDPYSQSTTGTVRVIAFQDCDIAVRHVESFSACMDVA